MKYNFVCNHSIIKISSDIEKQITDQQKMRDNILTKKSWKKNFYLVRIVECWLAARNNHSSISKNFLILATFNIYNNYKRSSRKLSLVWEWEAKVNPQQFIQESWTNQIKKSLDYLQDYKQSYKGIIISPKIRLFKICTKRITFNFSFVYLYF